MPVHYRATRHAEHRTRELPVNLSMTPINKAKAWGVHAVTASGVILALLALLALVDNKP